MRTFRKIFHWIMVAAWVVLIAVILVLPKAWRFSSAFTVFLVLYFAGMIAEVILFWKEERPRRSKYMAWISLAVCLVAVAMSWVGRNEENSLVELLFSEV